HAARLATGNDYAQSYVSEALPSAVAWAERLPGGAGRISLFRGLVDLACLEADASPGDASAAARDPAFELFFELDDLTWDTASHLDDLACLLESAGATREALQVRMRRVRLDDRWLSLLAGTINPDQRDEYARRLVVGTTGFLSFLLEHAPDDAEGRRLAVSLIVERKGAATSAAIRNDAVTLAGNDAGLGPLAARVVDAQQLIDARLAEGPSDGHQKLEWELDQLHTRLREETSGFAAALPLTRLPQPELASVAAIAAALPTGSVLIEFDALWQPDEFEAMLPGLHDATAERYVAVVVRAGAPEEAELVDLGPGSELERAIYTHLACLSPAER